MTASKKSGGTKRNTDTDQLAARCKWLEKKVESMEHKQARLEVYSGLLRDIAYTTNKQFKIETFLDRIMERVVAATACESATLFFHDKADQSLEFSVVKGPAAKQLKGRRMPDAQGIAGAVFSSGHAYITDDVTLDPVWNPQVAEEIGHDTRNICAIPLKAKGGTIGVIEVLNKEGGGDFTKEDVSLLKALAAEVTVVIENARLLLEARSHADRFVLLTRLSTILNSTLNQNQVRERAMEAAVELLECETGSLYLIDEEKNELYFEVALGEKGDAVKEVRLKMGEGIAGWAAQEGKSDLVPDTSKDPRWARRVDKKSKFQTRNMITVPVKARGRVIGVLQTINKLYDKKFDQEDLKLLESLADQVAIALENARLYEEQRVMFKETAEALATAIEKRDPYTGGHTKRVRDYCMATAKYLKLPPEDQEWLELAAILHDAGKIGVDDQVLRKPGRLDDKEFKQMKKHPVYGYEILQHVRELGPTIPGMRYHHERFDGYGYPEGLKDGDIPMIARIIAVADTWDAMTSDRPYRKGLPEEAAAKELRRCAGTQFDPRVVRAFLKAYKNGEIKSQKKGKTGRKGRGKVGSGEKGKVAGKR